MSMTNEQLGLLLRGYQVRIRYIIGMVSQAHRDAPVIKELQEFDNNLTRDILDLLRIERKGD